jgi:hypothetical protein
MLKKKTKISKRYVRMIEFHKEFGGQPKEGMVHGSNLPPPPTAPKDTTGSPPPSRGGGGRGLPPKPQPPDRVGNFWSPALQRRILDLTLPSLSHASPASFLGRAAKFSASCKFHNPPCPEFKKNNWGNLTFFLQLQIEKINK